MFKPYQSFSLDRRVLIYLDFGLVLDWRVPINTQLSIIIIYTYLWDQTCECQCQTALYWKKRKLCRILRKFCHSLLCAFQLPPSFFISSLSFLTLYVHSLSALLLPKYQANIIQKEYFIQRTYMYTIFADYPLRTQVME